MHSTTRLFNCCTEAAKIASGDGVDVLEYFVAGIFVDERKGRNISKIMVWYAVLNSNKSLELLTNKEEHTGRTTHE